MVLVFGYVFLVVWLSIHFAVLFNQSVLSSVYDELVPATAALMEIRDPGSLAGRQALRQVWIVRTPMYIYFLHNPLKDYTNRHNQCCHDNYIQYIFMCVICWQGGLGLTELMRGGVIVVGTSGSTGRHTAASFAASMHMVWAPRDAMFSACVVLWDMGQKKWWSVASIVLNIYGII